MSDQSTDSPPSSAFSADAVAKLLQSFAEESNRSFEASVDDLVRVRVGTTLKVLSVELLDESIDVTVKERLELAIAGAINLALQKSAVAAGKLFVEFEGQLKEQKNTRSI